MDKVPAQKGTSLKQVSLGTAGQNTRKGINFKGSVKPGIPNGMYHYGKGVNNGSVAMGGVAKLSKGGKSKPTNDRAK